MEGFVKEGATSEDLRKATLIAVASLKEEHREPQLTFEANQKGQKAHQLIQAMAETDVYLSCHFAECKLTLFLLISQKLCQRCRVTN